MQAFEAAFAERVGAADAVATTNCTTALHLALHVSGVGPGDEVIVPSLSFIATANAVLHCGARPVFADIDPLTYNLDPAAAERAITARTQGDHARPPGRACRPTWTVSSSSGERHGLADRRGRRLRDRRAPTRAARSGRSGRSPASRCTRAR